MSYPEWDFLRVEVDNHDINHRIISSRNHLQLGSNAL
jgi:hypothetical protein